MKQSVEPERINELKCPRCDGVVVTIMHKDTYRYGVGESQINLPVELPVRQCRSCDTTFLDHEAEQIKHEALCRHFGVLTPQEISAIRQRNHLSRAAFAELTGLGEATLSRWEKGSLIQTHANDRYLKLLAKPGGIDRLRAVVRQGQRKSETETADSTPRFRCIDETPQRKRQGEIFQLLKDVV